MNKELIPYAETGFFSKLMSDYFSGDEKLRPFYGNEFSMAGFEQQLQQKTFEDQKRVVLAKALTAQYEGIETTEVLQQNIKSLGNSNTYTVTTGHQLNLFTGPLYFIYKIVSAINLAKKLKDQFPDKNFVPIYWMASEDHDFDEISYFQLLNVRHEIKRAMDGPVGRMKLTNIEEVLIQFQETLAGRNGLEDTITLFKQSYNANNTFTEAVKLIVNALFGEYGLVVVDGDDSALKGMFSLEMKQELLERSSENNINTTSAKLEELGYKKQVNPRAINLFYIEDGLRERIVFEDNQYNVLNTSITFSESQILEELDQHPEKFSPNAVMRPLYQEVILPNLAYIGGGGELAYWFQLKTNFEARNIAYPILVLRNSALLLDGGAKKKMIKLRLSTKDLFQSTHDLMSRHVKEAAEVDLELNEERKSLQTVFSELEHKAEGIDASLKPMISAELQKVLKSIENIEKRLVKASKQKEEVAINQIEALKKRLFPNDSLQERYDNFIYGRMLMGPTFIADLITHLDPFDQQFAVLSN